MLQLERFLDLLRFFQDPSGKFPRVGPQLLFHRQDHCGTGKNGIIIPAHIRPGRTDLHGRRTADLRDLGKKDWRIRCRTHDQFPQRFQFLFVIRIVHPAERPHEDLIRSLPRQETARHVPIALGDRRFHHL